LVALTGMYPAASLAAEAEDVAQRRADLQGVQQRLREIEQAIASSERAHSDAVAKLAEAERAVSVARRKIRKLAGEQKAVEKALAHLARQQAQIEERISVRRDELAEWLRRHYMRGGSDMAPFLLARDPNQLARDVHYLEQLGRA